MSISECISECVNERVACISIMMYFEVCCKIYGKDIKVVIVARQC